MKCLVLALLLVLPATILSSDAGEWKAMKEGSTERFEFDPEATVFEFEIVPKKALKNLDINLATRLFDDSNKMVGVASFLFQMKGSRVTKSFLRLGTRNKNTLKYCYDRRTLKEQIPGNIYQDFATPSVYVINNSKKPNFAENKVCDGWRAMMAEKKISGAELVLWDHGRNLKRQIDIRVRVVNMETATTTFEPLTYVTSGASATYDSITFATTGHTTGHNMANLEVTDAPVASTGDICSVYPNGVIDTFDKKSEHYDLKCYHVLAASFGSPSWFIYGAYDKFDGKRSCRAMAVYVGPKAFEIVRGWLISYEGQKMSYTEGQTTEIPDTGCVMSLQNLHLTVDCRPGGYPFVVHYDGYMLAHIELFERSGSEIGLCFQNSRGRRVNWQIRNQSTDKQDCTISPVVSDCSEEAPQCAEFEDSCDSSLARACRELSCGPDEPKSEQICSLSQARKKKCRLLGSKVNGALTGCPEDVCHRKYFVLGAGCPQDPFFTGCPIEKYLDNIP